MPHSCHSAKLYGVNIVQDDIPFPRYSATMTMLTHPARANQRPRERARHWRAAEGIDLFEADYKRFTFPKHSHDYYAFGTVLNGAEKFTTRGTSHIARRGQLIAMNPMQVHDGGPGCDDGYHYQVLFINPQIFADLVAEISPKSKGLPSFSQHVINDPDLHLLLQKLHRIFAPEGRHLTSDLERDTQLFYSAARLSLRHADAAPYDFKPGAEDRRVRQVIDYMHSHQDENISLESLAALTGLSRFHLLRVFRDATGLPPHTYLNHMRLRRAKRMLFDGCSIADTAAATGFADQSHLNRHFKAMWGVSPSAFIPHTR